jgi:hypothetical protein
MAKRTFDIRVRNAIAKSSIPDLFPELEIPRKAALQWIRQGVKEVVTHSSFAMTSEELTWEIARLQKELDSQKAKNNLVKCSLEVVGSKNRKWAIYQACRV